MTSIRTAAIWLLAQAAVGAGSSDTLPTAMLSNPCGQLPSQPSREAQLALDWPFLCRYAAANTAVRKPPHAVFIGDSITEGWLVAEPGMFSADVLDRGISGQTSPQLLLRFYADVIALKPAVVHIMVGTNDVAGNTGPTSEKAYRDNIRAMTDLARAHHIRVVIGAIPPAARFWWSTARRPAAEIAALNVWLKSFARMNGLRFVDYWTAMAAPGGGMRADLTDDGVHPNAAGYAVMRPLALAAIR